jgi:hypothetical protein
MVRYSGMVYCLVHPVRLPNNNLEYVTALSSRNLLFPYITSGCNLKWTYGPATITNDAKCTREIKGRISMAKAAFNQKKTLFTSKLDLELRKILVEFYIWSIALYGVETWTLRKLDQKYLERFEIWCCRRMKISWTTRANNEAVLHRAKEERNILHTLRQREANWTGYILHRNCLLNPIFKGKIRGTRR